MATLPDEAHHTELQVVVAAEQETREEDQRHTQALEPMVAVTAEIKVLPPQAAVLATPTDGRPQPTPGPEADGKHLPTQLLEVRANFLTF